MWILGNTRIYVQKYETTEKQVIARLQPINGGTVQQVFGYESPITNIEAIVIGSGDANHIQSLTTSGVSFPLVSPLGTMGDFLVQDVKVGWMDYVYQSIRQDLDCETPAFYLSIVLQKE